MGAEKRRDPLGHTAFSLSDFAARLFRPNPWAKIAIARSPPAANTSLPPVRSTVRGVYSVE